MITKRSGKESQKVNSIQLNSDLLDKEKKKTMIGMKPDRRLAETVSIEKADDADKRDTNVQGYTNSSTKKMRRTMF